MAICVPVQKSQNLKGKTRANGKRLVKMTKIVSILSIFDGQKKATKIRWLNFIGDSALGLIQIDRSVGLKP